MPEENEQQIAEFLATHDDAIEVPLNTLNPDLQTEWGVPAQHGRQLFPTLKGHDGFYYCLLKKQ